MRISTSPWTPDTGASRSVALEVLIHGPISRSDIARRLDLSAGSLTRLSTPLIESGLLVEVEEKTDGRAGRPSRPLDIVPESQHFIGIKLTGVDVLGVLTDLRAAVIASEHAVLPSRDPDAVIATLVEVVGRLRGKVDTVSALGVGMGALIADHAVVTAAPFLEWSEVPLGTLLETATGIPTVIENDVVAFTEAEHWFGAGRGLDRFAVLTLGAGIGYGTVIHDEIVVDADSGIGLVGHWPSTPSVRCARPGIADARAACSRARRSAPPSRRSSGRRSTMTRRSIAPPPGSPPPAAWSTTRAAGSGA